MKKNDIPFGIDGFLEEMVQQSWSINEEELERYYDHLLINMYPIL